jgi:hypothetical protein
MSLPNASFIERSVPLLHRIAWSPRNLLTVLLRGSQDSLAKNHLRKSVCLMAGHYADHRTLR